MIFGRVAELLNDRFAYGIAVLGKCLELVPGAQIFKCRPDGKDSIASFDAEEMSEEGSELGVEGQGLL
jgi:hypothetical protein